MTCKKTQLVDGEFVTCGGKIIDSISEQEEGVPVLDQICAKCGKNFGLYSERIKPAQTVFPGFIPGPVQQSF